MTVHSGWRDSTLKASPLHTPANKTNLWGWHQREPYDKVASWLWPVEFSEKKSEKTEVVRGRQGILCVCFHHLFLCLSRFLEVISRMRVHDACQ